MDSRANDIQSRGLELAEFDETQVFGATPLGWVIAASTLGAVAIVIGVTARTAPVIGAIGAAVVLAFNAFFLWGLRLRTIVTREELRVGFRPRALERIPMEAITRAEAVEYDPLGDAGGWGWKHSRRRGAVRNVWGEHGVAIEYGDGKKKLIGSQRAEELEAAIHRLNPASKPDDSP
jgi:hypothetical protein